jgi:hypothetical protein
VDLLVMKEMRSHGQRGECLMIQCKTGKTLFTEEECLTLGSYKERTGHRSFLAWKQAGRIYMQELSIYGTRIGRPKKLPK